MSIELQIQSSILGAITARAVQARLLATCFQPIGAVYVDHADVAATPVELIAANAAVRLRISLDVFIVRREDVLAAPNAVPVGVTVPAGTVVVVLEMAATGAVVSLRCVDADLGPLGLALGASAPAAKAAIIDAIGSPMTSDLTEALKQLGIPVPTSSKVELISGIVAIRFEPSGDAVAHLFPGLDWGMFLDGVSVEKLAMSKVPNDLTSHITSLTIDAHWRPAGSTPHVDLDYAGKAPQVPDPFSGDVDGTLGCDFSLTPPPLRGLRTTVHWSLHINLGDFVPGFVDNLVESVIEGFMDPTKFGGTPIGDHAFTLDSPLPDVSFGGARFDYANIVASADGMTIGGAVRLPLDPGKATLQPSVSKFGLPFRLTFCRTLAKSGSGEPSKTVSLSEVTTNGSVWLENLGKFCDVEIVSPGNWIEPYIKRPTDTPEIRIVISSAVALGIVESVRLIVRTARGVRLVDLGTPPPVTLDANGNVTNALTSHIPDCLYINVEYGIKWAKAGGLLDQSVVKPPLEHPDWTTYLGRHRGIDVQLLTLSALEPGELIQFRSRDHAVDVTADRNGRALVPVLLPVANDQEPASLIRMNRRSIAGHFAVSSVIFVDQVSLPAGTQHRLSSLVNGTAVLTTEFEDHIDIHEIGSLGAPILMKRETACKQEYKGGEAQTEVSYLGATMGTKDLVQSERQSAISSQIRPSHEEVALNPQPLPPHEVVTSACNLLLVQRINLPGITSLFAVPGFPEAPIALATMADGSMLVLDLGEDGTARVAGTFTGPIGVLDVSGDWAIAADPDRISIYRVTREAKQCTCEDNAVRRNP
jgi:hypothetical protein